VGISPLQCGNFAAISHLAPVSYDFAATSGDFTAIVFAAISGDFIATVWNSISLPGSFVAIIIFYCCYFGFPRC
jgi:hypothetical protein